MTTHFTSNRIADIADIVVATAEVLGQEITVMAAEMMAHDLAEYSDAEISEALRLCRRELTGRLTLAAIIERINRSDGHLGANEAWAIALQASDESATVVTTEQITKAMAMAKPVLDNGDEVGARMAFIDAYKRLVDQARQAGIAAQFYPSLGWDIEQRKPVIEQAIQDGLLSRDDVSHLALEHVKPAGDLKLLAGPSALTEDELNRSREEVKKLFVVINNAKMKEVKQREERLRAQEAKRQEFIRHKESEIKRLEASHANKRA